MIIPITPFKIIVNVFGNWIFVLIAITHLWRQGRIVFLRWRRRRPSPLPTTAMWVGLVRRSRLLPVAPTRTILIRASAAMLTVAMWRGKRVFRSFLWRPTRTWTSKNLVWHRCARLFVLNFMEHIQGVVILEISDLNQGGGIDFLDPIYFSDRVFTFPTPFRN